MNYSQNTAVFLKDSYKKTSNLQILDVSQVQQMVGLSKPTIYRLMKVGEFPRPIRLSQCRVAWRLIDLENWLHSRPISEGL